MTLTVGTDSYISVSDADSYFTGVYGAQSWLDATDEEKELALKTATLRIERLSFRGTKAEEDQALAFPRCYPVWESTTTFVEGEPLTPTTDYEPGERCDAQPPQNVVRACCEEAFAILRGVEVSQRVRLQHQGVSSVKIGSTSESYSGRGGGAPLASPEAVEYLKNYIALGALG